MTEETLRRAVDTYGRALGNHTFQQALTNLGVSDGSVRVVLAETTIGEFRQAYPDPTKRPVVVIDEARQRIARLDFYRDSSATDVQVSNDTQFGMLVDYIASLHRDITAEVLQVCVHAQTREFDFA
jgi:hypothetical protein